MSAETKWEYHIETVHHPMLRKSLDTLGERGWELAGIVSTTEPPADMSSHWPAVSEYIFKRPTS